MDTEPKQLEHRTVKIRMRDLRALGACEEGREQHVKFLPATISTDPEENMHLALRLARAWDKIHARYLADVNQDTDAYGLTDLLVRHEAEIAFPRATALRNDLRAEVGWWKLNRDPQALAQLLAAMADDLSMAAGR